MRKKPKISRYKDHLVELRDTHGEWWKGVIKDTFKEMGNWFYVIVDTNGAEWHICTADVDCIKPAPEAKVYKLKERQLVCLKSGITEQPKKTGRRSKSAAR